MAVLPAEGVSRELLSTLQFDDIDEEGAIDTALGACFRGSLLSWSVGGDSVIMHRLVGRILCERDRASGRWPATLANALDLLEPHCSTSHVPGLSATWVPNSCRRSKRSGMSRMWNRQIEVSPLENCAHDPGECDSCVLRPI